MKKRLSYYLCIGTLLPLILWADPAPYEVHFVGISDPALIWTLTGNSDLIRLQEHPPASANGLQYRAQSDIPNLLKILRSHAYYAATITPDIHFDQNRFIVDLLIQLGPPFLLSSYEVFHGNCDDSSPISRCDPFSLNDLGLSLNQVATSSSIIQAENAVLLHLSNCGYPLALIDKRRVIVDREAHTVSAAVCVQEGPLARFGPITYFGLKSVDPRFIEKKIPWKEGDPFNGMLIDELQNRLIRSNLFSSVLITHAEELDQMGEVSMKVRLSEAKHRSVCLGFFYATVDGPGGTVSWTHRNLRGMGEYLNIEANASPIFFSGQITYRKPDFWRIDQTISALAEASRENITAYHASTYQELTRLEKNFSNRAIGSIGLKGEYISVHHSVNNGHFFDIGLPIFAQYSTIDTPLDPTKGFKINYIATPYQSLNQANTHYVKQKLVANGYLPLSKSNKVIFAVHTQFGSIAGAEQKKIPLPQLFLGGSEDDLRGYGYKTVSPLGRKKGKKDRDTPTGGRSAIFTSVELRLRLTKTIGVVPFADFGTVTHHEYPTFTTKWYKSVGGGLRYYTLFGPLRVDVGIPLDRRRPLDCWGKVYVSIGQCF